MNTNRHQTLFALRYAVRVLERSARLWGIASTTLKFFSVLSGTVALAALTAKCPQTAMSLGFLFAVLQAIDISLDPTTKRSSATVARGDYARLLATQAQHDDAALEAAYQAVVADDDVSVLKGLKELAYNDVVREQGLDESACFVERRLLRLLS